MEKNNSITRSISKFISLIYISIKITIKELLAKNGGHLSSGNTIVQQHYYSIKQHLQTINITILLIHFYNINNNQFSYYLNRHFYYY